jgi:hypothetical protein
MNPKKAKKPKKLQSIARVKRDGIICEVVLQEISSTPLPNQEQREAAIKELLAAIFKEDLNTQLVDTITMHMVELFRQHPAFKD